VPRLDGVPFVLLVGNEDVVLPTEVPVARAVSLFYQCMVETEVFGEPHDGPTLGEKGFHPVFLVG